MALVEVKVSVTIRPATIRDKKAWAAMRSALWPEAELESLEAELPDWLKRERFRAWLAVDRGVPVGFAEAYLREFANGCDQQPVAFLEGIWVEKSHRRKGIGRRLVLAVERWALGKGIKELGSDAYIGDRLSRRGHLGWGFAETERVVYFKKALKPGRVRKARS